MAKKISMTQAAKQVADAISGAENQTSIVTQCVKACAAHFQNEAPPKEDVIDFADKVAEFRGWSEASAKTRKSEVRKVIRHYLRMESACSNIAKQSDSFTWHNAIKVARLIHSNPKATDAAIAKLYFEAKPKGKTKTATEKAWDALAKFMAESSRAKDIIDLQAAVQKVLDSKGLELE